MVAQATDPCLKQMTRAPFYKHELTLNLADYMSSKVWDKITNPFPNFNGATVEVWEWISDFIPHFIMDVITYPRQD